MPSNSYRPAPHLAQDLSAAKVPEPRSLTKAIKEAQRIRASIPTTDATELAQAVLTATLKSVDPATDPAVQEAATRAAISTPAVADALNEQADEALSQGVSNAYDDVMSALQDAFKEAADTLQEAHQIIGNVPLDASASILSAGPEAAAAWAPAAAAVKRINRIRAAWDTLAKATRHQDSSSGRLQAFAYTEATYQEWRELDLGSIGLNPWKLLCAGKKLSLATHEQFKERGRQWIQEGEAEAAAAAQQRRKSAFASQWG